MSNRFPRLTAPEPPALRLTRPAAGQAMYHMSLPLLELMCLAGFGLLVAFA